MDDERLRTLYPNATLHLFPTYDPTMLSLACTSGYLWLDKGPLSPTEIQLLQHLTKKTQTHPTTSFWSQVLFSLTPPVLALGDYRIIQVSFQQKEAVDKEKWRQAVLAFFPESSDCFFMTGHYALIIEKKAPTTLAFTELESLFLALDGDMDTYTKVFIGCFYPESSPFRELFQEEERGFAHFLAQNTTKRMTTLPQVSLAFYLDPMTTTRTCLHVLAPIWLPDDTNLLHTLWQQQGNVSATAKALFMHRNTIQYQIDKFQQQTQLNLKQIDDLYFTQLLLQFL